MRAFGQRNSADNAASRKAEGACASVSRRRALGASVSAAALAAAPRVFGATSSEKNPAAPYPAINTGTLIGYELPVERQIELSSRAGFPAIELWARDIEAFLQKGGTCADLKKMLSDSGLKLENIIGFCAWAADDQDERAKGRKAFMREMETASELGAKHIAATGLGTVVLLDAVKNFFPYPREGGKLVDAAGPAKAIVYKTISDQFGKFSLFKVISGKVTPDMTLVNARSGAQEKLGHIYYMQGKKNIEVQEIGCGDIGAVSKLSDTKTGDTLCDSKAVEAAPGIEYAVPCYSMAIAPKTKGQEDKVAQGLARLGEEDRSFTITNNAETKQMVIAGAGDIHLDVLCSKLKNKFGVEVELSPAKVPYREKIRKPLKAHGRHKKQSGGHGQFGDVWIEFEPQDEQEDMIFAENVFGGSVPKNFFPAVEKGLRECCQKGVLAGYPMVFLKATLYDGSYHPVDSSEMAFKTAASLAYKELVNASPVILEPIGLLKVTIPDANMGDIMSDISSKRRGTVMGMNAEGGMQTVEAEVPMAEMSSYAIDLRSMTQGRGSFTLEFSRYNEAPAAVQQKIIDEAKANADE